jgi:uncharacterized iron-regulated membrane protein
VILGETLVERPSDALWCLGLIGTGIPAYFLWTSRKRRAAAADRTAAVTRPAAG